MKKINKICIVGTGSAGWITLAYLSNIFKNIKFTIVGSKEIPTIGVGEGTTPNLTKLLLDSGIDELDFLKHTNGTFKYGVKFENWLERENNWYNLFGETTYLNLNENSLLNAFRGKASKTKHIELLETYKFSLDEYFSMSTELYALLKAKKAPYSTKGKLNLSHPGYAYHIEADLIVEKYKQICSSRANVSILYGNVTGTIKNNHEDIDQIVIDNNFKLESDLFIDCTGFRKVLIGENCKFKKYNDLLCDRAIAGRVLYTEDKSDREPFTTSTAVENGWIWTIPLNNKIGSGFVYSSKFISDIEAEEYLIKYWKQKNRDIKIARRIKFESGVNTNQCYRNIVSVGLSSGFVEPLEANSITLTVLANFLIKQLLERDNFEWSESSQKIFNRILIREYGTVKDFVLAHYKLSTRKDSAFWQEYTLNRDNFISFCKQKISDMIVKPLLGEYEPQWVAFNWATMLHGLGCYSGTKALDKNTLAVYKNWNDNIVDQAMNYNTFIDRLHLS